MRLTLPAAISCGSPKRSTASWTSVDSRRSVLAERVVIAGTSPADGQGATSEYFAIAVLLRDATRDVAVGADEAQKRANQLAVRTHVQGPEIRDARLQGAGELRQAIQALRQGVGGLQPHQHA